MRRIGYTLDGELLSKTVGAQTTSYTYDPLGNLLHVGPASGSAIDYVVDGENRRVGKKVGGTLRLAGVGGMVDRVLKMTQVHKVIPIFPTAADAAKDFPG